MTASAPPTKTSRTGQRMVERPRLGLSQAKDVESEGKHENEADGEDQGAEGEGQGDQGERPGTHAFSSWL